ncbi:MAG: hypothetical protein WCR46_06875 [Deltaproteobacteria bacterium]
MNIPSYCSSRNSGDCLSCRLSDTSGRDCQDNDFFICLDDEEPIDDDRDQEVSHG